MPFFLLFALIFTVSNAFANANALFGANGSYVKIIIQGPQGDRDSKRLFDLLNAPAVPSGNSFRKEISFQDQDGVNAFTVTCNLSRLIADFGSCTVGINQARSSDIRPGEKYAAYTVSNAEELASIAQLFVIPPNVKQIYVSNDHHLKILHNKENGRFEIVYQDLKQF